MPLPVLSHLPFQHFWCQQASAVGSCVALDAYCRCCAEEMWPWLFTCKVICGQCCRREAPHIQGSDQAWVDATYHHLFPNPTYCSQVPTKYAGCSVWELWLICNPGTRCWGLLGSSSRKLAPVVHTEDKRGWDVPLLLGPWFYLWNSAGTWRGKESPSSSPPQH